MSDESSTKTKSRRAGSTRKQQKKNGKKELMEEYIIYETEKLGFLEESKIYQNYDYLSSKSKKEFETKFSVAKNIVQEKYLRSLKNPNLKIVIATGPAGTGKTLLGVEQGVRNFLLGNFQKIIFTRPVVSVDEDIGYLPGTLEEKMAPWIRPIHDILYQFITPKEVESLIEEKIIEICPLGFMRGRTFKHTWIVADEMQNSSVSQMKMLLTRLGENSRLVITGDLDQTDRADSINGLEDFLDKMRGRRSESISSIEFDKANIERETVVKEVLEIYEMSVVPPMYQSTFEMNNTIIEGEFESLKNNQPIEINETILEDIDEKDFDKE